jgi:hypothetical protein
MSVLILIHDYLPLANFLLLLKLVLNSNHARKKAK